MTPGKLHTLALLGEYQACLNGHTVPYQLKQSRRIRGIRLEIRHDSGLTVVVPARYKQDQIDEILHKKTGWILHHLPDNRPVQMPLFNKEVDHGEKISYMGRKIELVVTNTSGRPEPVSLEGQRIRINLNGHEKSIAGILEKWYRSQAGLIFTQKAETFKGIMGVNYTKILIRGQKTRWGSCSHGGTLSLNWKLLMAPEPVIDYVIIHELAHLNHMNHSRKFWEFVAVYCPNWEKHRRWLIVHEEDLKASSAFGQSPAVG